MRVSEQTVVTLRYELRNNDEHGQLIEIMNAVYPFVFLFGTGKLLPAFEDQIRGLMSGDEFEFKLECTETYGMPKESNIVNVPRKAFLIDGIEPEGMLQIGQQLTVKDDQGYDNTGKILEYDQQFVRMDFNDVMAGKDLHFKGAIINVRKATVDELISKHHLPGA